MIYGKLWCVVKPSVGIPLFLSAVAISSFAVHLTLLNTAPWLKNYYVGGSGEVGGCGSAGDDGRGAANDAARGGTEEVALQRCAGAVGARVAKPMLSACARARWRCARGMP